MLKHSLMTSSLLYIFLGGVLGYVPIYGASDSSSSGSYSQNRSQDPSQYRANDPNSPNNSRSKSSSYPSTGQSGSNRSNNRYDYGKEEIAYEDYTDTRPSSYQPIRKGNWDNRQNWKYDREAYLRGETQAQVYRERNPFGPGGIGYDADENYVRARDQYNRAYYANNRSLNRDTENTSNNRSSYMQSEEKSDNRYDNSNGDYDRSGRSNERYRSSRYDRSYDRNNYQDRSSRVERY